MHSHLKREILRSVYHVHNSLKKRGDEYALRSTYFCLLFCENYFTIPFNGIEHCTVLEAPRKNGVGGAKEEVAFPKRTHIIGTKKKGEGIIIENNIACQWYTPILLSLFFVCFDDLLI